MLEFMVNLTSWVIRAGGAIAMLIGLYGLIQLFRGEFLWGIAGIITGIVFIVILGGVAVAFRISEQLLEIKNILIMNSDVKVIDKANDDVEKSNQSDVPSKNKPKPKDDDESELF